MQEYDLTVCTDSCLSQTLFPPAIPALPHLKDLALELGSLILPRISG